MQTQTVEGWHRRGDEIRARWAEGPRMAVTLTETRRHVEELASDDGDYYVVCSRTGHRPVPVAGKWFDSRATARSGARAAEQYRAKLRQHDPLVPWHDLIVCQESTATVPDTTITQEQQ